MDSMKRILLSAYVCSPYAGTEPGNGWNWAKHLSERGMDVHVLAEWKNRPNIEKYCSEHPEIKIRFSYFQIGYKHFQGKTGTRYALWQWKAVSEARKLLKTEQFDIVHHVTLGSIHVPSRLWKLKIPVVFGPVGGGQTSPDSMIEYFGADQKKERLRTRFTRLLPYSPFHRYWFGKMGAVLATNRETLDVFRSLGREDAILSFDTALPESFFAEAPRMFSAESKPLRLLWVGRILPRKALPLTLDILARVKTPVTLTIMGEGMEESVVREMIRSRGLEDKVFWKPERIPWDEVRAAYGNHDAMLFTSLRDSCAAQLLESMAMGLPVITLAIHGGRDLVPDDAGFKIPVQSKEQVIADTAAVVDRYAAMPAEAKNEMSRAGWSFAKTLTWNNRAAFAENLYDQLLHPTKATQSAGATLQGTAAQK